MKNYKFQIFIFWFIFSLGIRFIGEVNSEILAKECVSLPIDPMLKKKEINFVIKKINNY